MEAWDSLEIYNIRIVYKHRTHTTNKHRYKEFTQTHLVLLDTYTYTHFMKPPFKTQSLVKSIDLSLAI